MKHILFDTDGVLVHSDMWSLEYCRQSGISPDRMKPFFGGVFQDCLIGKADLKNSIAPYLKEWGWNKNVEEYLSLWFNYENQVDGDLVKKIQELRKSGIMCYIATNQEKYRLNYLRNEMGFGKNFDSIFCSAELGKKKPSLEFYEKILKTLKIENPEDVLYFDDAEENIESAKKLGIQAILYKNICDCIIPTNFLSSSLS